MERSLDEFLKKQSKLIKEKSGLKSIHALFIDSIPVHPEWKIGALLKRLLPRNKMYLSKDEDDVPLPPKADVYEEKGISHVFAVHVLEYQILIFCWFV